MTRYIKNIILLLNKQANKGIDKYGVTLEEIMQKNVDKLKKRYPDGFDKNKSINR